MDQDENTPPCFLCWRSELQSIESSNPMCMAAANALEIFKLMRAGVTINESDLNWAEAEAIKAIGQEYEDAKAKSLEGMFGG